MSIAFLQREYEGEKLMKKIIGVTILISILICLVAMTCLVTGWKDGLICWGIGFAVAMIICFAIFLIEDGT